MKTITKLFKEKRAIAIALTVVVVLVVCWLVFGKNLWRKIVNTKAMNDAESHTGTNVTPHLDFPRLRDRLFDAIAWPGTDEDEIYSVLVELNTQADWEYLQRYWENSMSKQNIGWGGLILSGMMGASVTLIGTLKSELNRKELQRCRDILEGKGIVPGF